MDEGEPGGVERAEGHVLPDVAVHEVRRRVERHQDHQRRVRHRPLYTHTTMSGNMFRVVGNCGGGHVKSVEEPWVCEVVVRLVRVLVEPGGDAVLAHIIDKLR